MLHELRYAMRSLRNSPTFTLVAVITLATGIGVTTASLALTDWLLLRPVPGVADPGRLAIVWSASRGETPSLMAAAGLNINWISYAQHDELTQRLTTLSGLAGYQAGEVNLGAHDAMPRRVNVQYVMPSYFRVLDVRPSLGRALLPEDDAAPQGAPVAVISDALWAGMFQRDPGVLGKRVRVDGSPFTVVGVAPPEFHGTERLGEADLWLPGRVLERARLGGYYQFVARLAPGARFAQAEAQLHAVFAGLGPTFDAQLFRGLGIPPMQRPQVTQLVRLAITASVLVLLIACANVANLFLFRGLSRRSLTALHKVLGARSVAVVRRQLIEGVTIAVPALIAGILLASWFVLIFQGVAFSRWTRPFGRIPIGWPVVGLAAVVALATAALATVAPALTATRIDPVEAVQGTARTHAAGGVRLRRALTVIQLGLSLSLVVGALLIVRTLERLNAIDIGFQPRNVYTLQMDPAQPEPRAYYRELRNRLSAAPGLGQVAIAWRAPFTGMMRIMAVFRPGTDPDSALRVRENLVSPGYFRLLEQPLVAGRPFAEREFLPDSSVPPKIILSESVARRLFGDAPATGRLVVRAPGGRPEEVVGVVRDTRWEGLDATGSPVRDPRLMIYTPFGQEVRYRGVLSGGVEILVRSGLTERAVGETVRRVAGELDRSVPAYGISSMVERIKNSILDRLLFGRLLGALAILALVLAVVGLYGLVAYGVAAHTREFGIRIALGAEARAIGRLVLREAVLLASAGVAAGLAGGVALSRLIASRLYGVGSLDPLTYSVSVALLFAVAVLAAWVPARAATRVDPMVALRAE